MAKIESVSELEVGKDYLVITALHGIARTNYTEHLVTMIEEKEDRCVFEHLDIDERSGKLSLPKNTYIEGHHFWWAHPIKDHLHDQAEQALEHIKQMERFIHPMMPGNIYNHELAAVVRGRIAELRTSLKDIENILDNL